MRCIASIMEGDGLCLSASPMSYREMALLSPHRMHLRMRYGSNRSGKKSPL